MRVKDIEVNKVNSSDIKRLEKILYSIDKIESDLLVDFDSNIHNVFGESLLPILKEIENNPYLENVKTHTIKINNEEYKVPDKFLMTFHKSFISDPNLRGIFEEKLKIWFADKTNILKKTINRNSTYDDLYKAMPSAYALASIALTTFHKKPNMVLRDVQKMTGIVVNEGNIAELGTGEGKTLASVLPVYLQALREKGAHVITANQYLSKRDFEETLPIFEGLGLTSKFLPETEEELAEIEGYDKNNLSIPVRYELQKKLRKIKQEAYRADITYGSKSTFAFDYLRDNLVTNKDDLVQREERSGFALIDEVDDALIDDATVPYIVAQESPMYKKDMTLRELCILEDIPYLEIKNKVANLGIINENLTYDEAKYIAKTFGKFDLLPDPSRYQEISERFFKHQKVYETKDNMFNFKTSKELFDAICDEEKYKADVIREKYGIVFCKETKEFKVTDKCYDDFLKYSYFAMEINSQVIKYQNQLITDKNYVPDVDYFLKTDGKIKLTMKGANKLINDTNYPEFIENYNNYMSLISLKSAKLIHYFNQTIIANLIMEKDKDYVIDSGKIKVLKNGRIMEGSTYSNGLHQALEIKEGIDKEFRTKENVSNSTITQKDFYQRYDMFSGMTGTSSESVFKEIFLKDTVSIPKHAFYSFYSDRKTTNREPIGIEKKDVVFSNQLEDKLNLIVNSVIESVNSFPKQPVLLVVSDVNEIKLLAQRLKEKNIKFNILDATTSKEDEALIIAQAGVSGSVTISTEMAGRGTDIKIGGDRDTIIDIATSRHIRNLEKKQGKTLIFSEIEKDYLRSKVENALINSEKIKLWSKNDEEKLRHELETVGLKVISSGFFNVNRIDRQLEGRTGRNGISGVCERYACVDDLKRIGLDSIDFKDSVTEYFNRFSRKFDGSLDIDSSSYKKILDRIDMMQKNNEGNIKELIKETQKVDNYATNLVERYRDQRRKILTDSTDLRKLTFEMIEKATDGVLSSYTSGEINKNNLLIPLNKKVIDINIEMICLEIKEILGITIDSSVIEKSNINFFEFRDAIIRTAKERIKEFNNDDLRRALLNQNDYMISSVPELLEHSLAVRRLSSLVTGLEGQVDYRAEMDFDSSRRKLSIESCKQGLKSVIGIPFSVSEFKAFEKRKKMIFDSSISKVKDVQGTLPKKHEENNLGLLDKMRSIREKVDIKNKRKIENIEKEIENKGINKVDISDLYSKLDVRPMMFVKTMTSDGKEYKNLILVKNFKNFEKGITI